MHFNYNIDRRDNITIVACHQGKRMALGTVREADLPAILEDFREMLARVVESLDERRQADEPADDAAEARFAYYASR